MDLERIWLAIREIEKAEGLANWKVGDVYLWQVIRERMFTHIAELTGQMAEAAAKVAADLHGMGYNLVATRGTAAAISATGIPVCSIM